MTLKRSLEQKAITQRRMETYNHYIISSFTEVDSVLHITF
jgi:hypothetical protein